MSDAYGPIDAVVTWVDGTDPLFLARRAEAVERLRREDPALAKRSELRFSAARYIGNDEIRYCVRSILNHAPWVRKVWIVTDDQFPTSFDRTRLDPRVVFVSHREMFREIPDALPVFNSGAIEMMLWRIEGLSNRFVYFNDDVFLTKAVEPTDFFDDDHPVLRGRWSRIEPSPPPSWLGRRVRSAELFGYDANHFFKEAHTPFGLSRPVIAEMLATIPEVEEYNARMRFRSSSGHYIVGLHNHFCLRGDRAVVDGRNKWLVLNSYPADGAHEWIDERLEHLAAGQYFSTCFNDLGAFAAGLPPIYDILCAATGPRLAFET